MVPCRVGAGVGDPLVAGTEGLGSDADGVGLAEAVGVGLGSSVGVGVGLGVAFGLIVGWFAGRRPP